jgi:putative nucleotidyltransferase with HDIG domain
VLLGLGPSPRLVTHMAAVADIAAFLAARIVANGIRVDRRLVESAALLHDLDKALPDDHPLKPLGHGDAGAAWVTEHGLEELARPIANHPVSRLGDDERYARWSSFASREERVVAYADKRAAQRLQSMDARFARWHRRHPDLDARLRVARRRADRLEADVCRAAGVRPDEVRRLPWARAALARAGSDR